MRASLAARYPRSHAASEAAGGAATGGAGAAGHGILHARWLPRLPAAIEPGAAWGRLRLLLREAAGAHDGDGGLVVSELLCEPRYLSRRADALGAERAVLGSRFCWEMVDSGYGFRLCRLRALRLIDCNRMVRRAITTGTQRGRSQPNGSNRVGGSE